MKKVILITTILFFSSCANQINRQKNLEKMYPKCKVEPATGLIQKNGYNFIVIDTNTQIIAVSFYLGSESKIYDLRNIR